MRKQPVMFLDITKKPGDPTAVKTMDDIFAERDALREENANLKKKIRILEKLKIQLQKKDGNNV